MFTSAGTSRLISIPFPDHPLTALIPDGTGVAVVERSPASDAEAAEFRITVVGPGGDTVARASHPYQPLPVTDGEVQRAVSTIRDRLPEPRPATSEIERALREGGLIPATHVPVTGLVPAQDGTLWIRREEVTGGTVPWTVFGSDGRHLGEVRLPAGQTVAAARDDLLATTEEDDLGVSFVQVYRIHRD